MDPSAKSPALPCMHPEILFYKCYFIFSCTKVMAVTLYSLAVSAILPIHLFGRILLDMSSLYFQAQVLAKYVQKFLNNDRLRRFNSF